MIRSKTLVTDAHSVYSTGKEFMFDHVMWDLVYHSKKKVTQG